MCTHNELNIITQKMAEIYRGIYADNLVKIVLYGSYARGDYDRESDIDIVAIVQGDRELLQQQLKLAWDKSADLELEYNTIISPTVIPYQEFEKYRDDIPYYKNIALEGVEIKEREI